MANDWEQYAVADTPSWEQYAVADDSEPPEEELGGMEKFYRASGIHGANKAFANVFGFGKHVKNANEAAERARTTHPGATAAGEFAADVYSSLPFYLAGGGAASAIPKLGKLGKAGKAAQRVIGSGIGQGIFSAVRNPEEGESRAGNATKDALIAALVDAVLPGLGKVAAAPFKGAGNFISKSMLGSESKIAKDVLSGLSKAEAGEAGAVYDAGKRLGLDLTPAESAGNPILAKFEGSLGSSPEGQQAYTQFKKGQKGAQENAIEGFLNQVSPSAEVASADIRNAATSIIDKDTKALIKKASPYYQAAEKQIVSPNKLNSLLKDSNIETAWSKVLKDPLYKTELEGFTPNTVKTLDLTKRALDDQIAAAVRGGENNAARILQTSKQKLVEALDKISPDYKKARSIYSQDAKPLQKLKESNLGKIADMSDQKLKTVSKTIFDPSETDIKVLGQLRDRIKKEDPKAWNKIIRNEMERRLDSKTLNQTGNAGSNFYKQIVGNDRDFNQFYTALEGDAVAQSKLTDMRASFKNLINSYTVKTAAGQAKSSLDVPRSSFQWIKNYADNLIGGKYDQTAVEIITNPEWRNIHLPKITSKSTTQDRMKFLKTIAELSKRSAPINLAAEQFHEGDNE